MPFFGVRVSVDKFSLLFNSSMEEISDEKDNRRRVKLYILNEKRTWEDKGTGHVTCDVQDNVQISTLIVRCEQDDSVMLECEIQPDTVYNKQQETLIVWTDSDTRDLALSFQEKKGCDEIWADICRILGKDATLDSTNQYGACDSLSDEENGENGGVKFASEPILELPPCEIGRLAELNEVIAASFTALHHREALACAIENEEYITKLLDIFQQCEDVEDVESLHLLFKIFKNIFYLNKSSLFDCLFAPENLLNVIGVLEYDPSDSTPKKHRQFLCHQAQFKEVIPITSGELTSKIHQTYRIKYIYNVIFPAPSIFEENLLSMMSTMIMYNKSEIVHLVQEDPMFLKQLFGLLEEKSTPNDKMVDLAGFLKELVTFSQLLNAHNREGFFRTLVANGIMGALENCLSNKEDVVQSLAVDVLVRMIDYHAAYIREYAMKQDGSFLNCLMDVMFNDRDSEMGRASQVVSIMKILLDPESMMAAFTAKCETYEFLTLFYKNCMHNLCSPIFSCTTVKTLNKDTYRVANLVNVLLEMLTFCFEHHTYHIRGFMVTKDLLTRVLVFLQSRYAFVALSALRLLRKTLSLRDEYYYAYIVRHRLFDPVLKCFKENGSTYNLLNSALLEMFEYIRTENIKPLIRHVVEEYGDIIDQVDYVSTFRLLKARYEQQPAALSAEESAKKLTNVVAPLNNQNERARNEDEDHWFNDEDAEDSCEQLSSLLTGTSSTAATQKESASPSALASVIPVALTDKEEVVNTPPLKALRSDDDGDEDFTLNSAVVPVGRKMNIVIGASSSSQITPSLDDSAAQSPSFSTSSRSLVDYGDSDSDEEEEEEVATNDSATACWKDEKQSPPALVDSPAKQFGNKERVVDCEMFKFKKQRRIDETSS